jgi:hypothetical protein
MLETVVRGLYVPLVCLTGVKRSHLYLAVH